MLSIDTLAAHEGGKHVHNREMARNGCNGVYYRFGERIRRYGGRAASEQGVNGRGLWLQWGEGGAGVEARLAWCGRGVVGNGWKLASSSMNPKWLALEMETQIAIREIQIPSVRR